MQSSVDAAAGGPLIDPSGERRLDEPDAGGTLYDAQGRPVTEIEPELGLEDGAFGEGVERLVLREEELVARKTPRELGDVEIRKVVENVPGRIEVDACREEIEVEHVPVGKVVSERMAPWEEDGTMVVPVYEEQLVVVKRLVLREHLRIRRIGTTERQVFEDTLRKERLVVEDPAGTGLVDEVYPDEDRERELLEPEADRSTPARREDGGFFENLVRKALA